MKERRLLSYWTGLLAALILVGTSGCQRGHAGKVERLTLGVLPGGSGTLMYIAQDRHFFADNGLSVTIKDDYPSGVATTEALLNGDIDIAWTAEYPMVVRAFEKSPLSIIGGTGRFSTEFLIARKDQGIATISDLRGKTIGVALNTIAEFYLARFLTLNGLNPGNVALMDLPASQALELIKNESLDGVVTWDPFAAQILEQLGDKAVAWSIQGNQPGYGLLVARQAWIGVSTEILNRLLKSLVQAEAYLIQNPTAAKNLVQKRLGVDDASMQAFWSEIQPFVSLDQSLILAMEDEARWMIENRLTPGREVPNFLDYIYEASLKAVNPDAVNIIR